MFAAAMAAAILIRPASRNCTLAFIRQCRPITYNFLLSLQALLSIVYSINPLYTAAFATRFASGVVLFAYFVATRRCPEKISQIVKTFYLVFFLQWLAIAVLFMYRPSLIGTELRGVGYRLDAALFNDFGVSAALTGVFALQKLTLASSMLHELIFLIVYTLTLYFVYLSRTRFTIFFAFSALLITLALSPRLRHKLLFTCTLLALLLVVQDASVSEQLLHYIIRGQSYSEFLSLTGRVQALNYLLSFWREAPVLGLGFAAGSRARLADFVRQSGMQIGSAHDAISKILVELGLIGLTFLSLSLAFAVVEVWRGWRSAREQRAAIPLVQHSIALLGFAVCSSVASAGISDLCFPFLLAVATARSARGMYLAKSTNFS